MEVKFDEQQITSRRKTSDPGGLVGFLIKKGIVKNKSQANILLVVFVVICALFIFFQNSSPNVPEAEDIIDPADFLE